MNIFLNGLINFLIQISVFVGAVYLVGFLISRINKLFYYLAGTSRGVIYGTAFFGTPIHELSHAFFCLVFFHKIEEIKLFQIDDEDGTLGYVRHTYNKKNIYHLIGCFFIGTAPILVGTALLMLLMWLIVPASFNGINASVTAAFAGGFEYIKIFEILWGSIVSFFSGVGDWRWWVYLIPVILIAIHMNLSTADLQGSVIGIPFIILIFFIINLALFWTGSVYDGYCYGMAYAEVYLILILFMSLVFSIISLVPALLIYIIRRATHRV